MSKVVLNPYLTFGGKTRQAMEFYHQVLGGTLDIQTFGDFGAPVSESYKQMVMHARIDADGLILMASDSQEGSMPVVGDNVNLSLSGGPEDRDRLTRVFSELSDGGTTSMPLSDAPWGAIFGMFTDRFGINWLVNIEKAAGQPS
jgi:PhnB protein